MLWIIYSVTAIVLGLYIHLNEDFPASGLFLVCALWPLFLCLILIAVLIEKFTMLP